MSTAGRARDRVAGADLPGRVRQDHHPGGRGGRGPRAGRPVLAVSTTNQAVSQLRQVGIPATTVARFALDRAELPPGSVVIVDEFSQLSTREPRWSWPRRRPARAGRCGWSATPSKPSRSAPAAWPAGSPTKSDSGRVATAELTVNRRQADPVEREALRRFRAGDIPTSQELRDRAGWEHHHADRTQALEAMAAAVVG